MKTITSVQIVLSDEEIKSFKKSAEILNNIFDIMRDNKLQEIPILVDEEECVTWENTYTLKFLEGATDVLECFQKGDKMTIIVEKTMKISFTTEEKSMIKKVHGLIDEITNTMGRENLDSIEIDDNTYTFEELAPIEEQLWYMS